MSLFGTSFTPFIPCTPVPFLVGLFDAFPIGAALRVGMDAGFWTGSFGGIQDGPA